MPYKGGIDCLTCSACELSGAVILERLVVMIQMNMFGYVEPPVKEKKVRVPKPVPQPKVEKVGIWKYTKSKGFVFKAAKVQPALKLA